MRPINVNEQGTIDPEQLRTEDGEVVVAIDANELRDLNQALMDGIIAARRRVREFGGRGDGSSITVDPEQSGRMAVMRDVIYPLIVGP